MRKQYFSMEQVGNEANINIFGDITSEPWFDSENEVTAKKLSAILDSLGDVKKLNVYINSYGGEVAEGLAIYNALKRSKAKVTTYCDGFAASIASVIFMAGDKRVMNDSSLLMIHNAWTFADGNAEQLRKIADDLEKITQASVNAYKANSTLTEAEIKALMDDETWILPEEALEYGFATHIENNGKKTASQCARLSLFEFIKQKTKSEDEPEDPKDDEEEPKDDEEDPADDSDDSEENEAEGEDDAEGEEPEDEDDPEGKKTKEYLNGIFNAILKM